MDKQKGKKNPCRLPDVSQNVSQEDNRFWAHQITPYSAVIVVMTEPSEL